MVVGGLLVLLGLGFLWYASQSQSTEGVAHVKASSQPVALIQITPTGFVPNTISVVHGTKVIWVNQDVLPHRVAADPYPTHSQLPALYAPKALGQKETYSFTFTKSRTVQYHDDLQPMWQGVIVVK